MPRSASVFDSPQPLVFAHRGGAQLAPENTMPALDNGMALGSDGLEFDVRLSADGIPVLMHDETLDRTTDRRGPVSALTADELARVDAGFHFEIDGAFPFRGMGIGVPTLASALERHGGARIIIEMKGDSPELGRAVGRAVRAAGLVERVCVASFQQRTIDAVRTDFPEIATTASQEEARWALHRSWVSWPRVSPRPYAAFQVPERVRYLRVVSRSFVRQIHREGQVLQVWVVNTREDVHRLLDWGVDGIISDRPDIAIAARDEWASRPR